MTRVRPGEVILYLSRADVIEAAREVDAVAVIRETLRLHASGETVLPGEAYLAWTTPAGGSARSINMPSFVGGEFGAAGTKVINANPANLEHGLPRAGGLTVLFDPETSCPACILDASHLSATRTAAVTALALELVGPPVVDSLALIGAGALARAHLELLPARLPGLSTVRIHDVVGERAQALAAERRADLERLRVCIEVAPDAERAIRNSALVVTVTTTTSGYIRFDWLRPGSLLVNISLDDPLPEVVLRSDLLLVDDWRMVSEDERRLLGRMYRAGQVCAPGDRVEGARPVDGEIGDVLLGRLAGRRRPEDIVMVNPFGLSVEDVALASRIFDVAARRGLGTTLPA